jgi:hypothetical protein
MGVGSWKHFPFHIGRSCPHSDSFPLHEFYSDERRPDLTKTKGSTRIRLPFQTYENWRSHLALASLVS